MEAGHPEDAKDGGWGLPLEMEVNQTETRILDSLPALSDTVASSHVWLSKCKSIKILNIPQPH